MSDEIQLLVEAIKSTKPDENVFKDYIFPISTAFFSSLLGGAVAYLTLKHQDAVLFEKEKLNTINKFMIIGTEAIQSSLCSIKGNYFEKLNEDPYQRMLKTPPIIGEYARITEPLDGLYFISPKIQNGKPNFSKWSQIGLIHALFKNYNLVIEIWKKRNELDARVRAKLLTTYSNEAFTSVTKDMIRASVSAADLVQLIDFTEQAVKLTDDLILETNDFLENFPIFAESKIKMHKIRNYGTILKIKNTRENTYLHTKCCPAKYELISDLFGLSADDIKKRYYTGYEELM